MGISTSTGTLTAGQSRTFNLSPASAVTLTLSPNVRVTITETPATVAATGLGGNASRVHEPRLTGTFTYGPYPMGGSVLVENEGNSGSSVAWVRSDSIVAESADGAVSLVDGGGNSYSLTPLSPEALRSWLPAPVLQQVSSGGAPSLLSLTAGSTSLFFWSMSGVTSGQSVVGAFDLVSTDARVYGIEISVLLTTNAGDTSKHHVFRAVTTGMRDGQGIVVKEFVGNPAIGRVMTSNFTKRLVLESYVPLEANAPISVRVIRENADVADDFTSSTGIVGISVRALALPTPITVQPASKYNSWPLTFPATSGRTVVVYSRGDTHTLSPADGTRGVFARYSNDNGATFQPSEITVTDIASNDESATGHGVDASGNLLVWVRRNGLDSGRTFHLYRSTDGGLSWSLISSPTFGTNPIQIADIIVVPTVGLMAFYHAGIYGSGSAVQSWGKVVSTDNGVTWTQTAIETGLLTAVWPTEIAAVYVGAGKIIAQGRNEASDTDTASTKANFQLTSSDYGATWTNVITNITDTNKSTASLVYDPVTDALTCYYFHRDWGALKRRKTTAAVAFTAPLDWPDSEALAIGTRNGSDTGNASAAFTVDGRHFATYYSGDATNAGIFGVQVSAT